MKQRKISFRLNTHITTIAILIITAIVIANFLMSKKVIIKSIEEGAINHSNLIISRISRITIGTEEIAKNISQQVLYYQQNNDVQYFINQIIESNSILENIEVELLIENIDSIVRYSSVTQTKTACVNDPSWIKLFKRSRENLPDTLIQGIWSDPFYCKIDTSHLLVAYILPVYKPNSTEIAGVVTCEISLRNMRKLLSEIKIGKSGYAFIIDKMGNFVTHPDESWILHMNLFEKPSRVFKGNVDKIESKIMQNQTGADRGISLYLNSHKAWFYFAPLANTGWKVIIVFPENELFSEINTVFKQIGKVAILGILILFLVNIFVFRKLLDPLERVTRAIQRFTFTPGKEPESGNEIKLLAESLENWQLKYGL